MVVWNLHKKTIKGINICFVRSFITLCLCFCMHRMSYLSNVEWLMRPGEPRVYKPLQKEVGFWPMQLPLIPWNGWLFFISIGWSRFVRANMVKCVLMKFFLKRDLDSSISLNKLAWDNCVMSRGVYSVSKLVVLCSVLCARSHLVRCRWHPTNFLFYEQISKRGKYVYIKINSNNNTQKETINIKWLYSFMQKSAQNKRSKLHVKEFLFKMNEKKTPSPNKMG